METREIHKLEEEGRQSELRVRLNKIEKLAIVADHQKELKLHQEAVELLGAIRRLNLPWQRRS